MKIEKIRKINKSKIIIGGLIGLGVIGALTILPSYSKYRTTQSFNLVKGKITYKQPDLNLVAMYTIESETEEPINTVPPEDDGSYTYALNTTRSECTYNGGKVGSITYANGYLTFSQINKKGTKCNVYFDKTKKPEGTPANELLADLKNGAQDIGTTFTNVETGSGGLYSTPDLVYGGKTYYYRGAVTNNYVIFAGKCWRIIRINGNGSIRLIFDSSTTECKANGEREKMATKAYNSVRNDNAYVGYMMGIKDTGNSTSYDQAHTNSFDSTIKTYLDGWYDSNIDISNGSGKKYSDYIDEETGFCNDRSLASGYSGSSSGYGTVTTNYKTYDRIAKTPTNAQPTMGCPNATRDLFTPSTSSLGNKLLGKDTSRPIGLITADEVVFAGALYGSTYKNEQFYLYSATNRLLTMTPSHYNSAYSAAVFCIQEDGHLSSYSAGNGAAVCPVINIKSTIRFSVKEGEEKGTMSNPYVVQ